MIGKRVGQFIEANFRYSRRLRKLGCCPLWFTREPHVGLRAGMCRSFALILNEYPQIAELTAPFGFRLFKR